MSNKVWLIAILFFVAPTIMDAQQKIFFNAKIFTGDRQRPYAEAIAIKGKSILAVGSFDEVKKITGENGEWIDMKGGFLMPGFIDSHIHAIKGGAGLTKANVSDKLLTIEELSAYAQEVMQKKEGMTGDVLVIYGLNISSWSQLNRIIEIFNSTVFSHQPLVLRGSDGHTAWCNNAMLQKAGITKKYLSGLPPEEKQFYGLLSNGEPNGFLSEKGITKVSGILSKEVDFHKAAEKAIEYTNGLGITAWLDPSAGNTDSTDQPLLDAYAYLANSAKLTAHVAATIVANANAEPQQQIDTVKSLQKRYRFNNFSILGLKIFADGVIEHPTHTAALSIPYTGTNSKGVLMIDPARFAKLAVEADRQNLLVHVHAIGDRAVTETLKGFETVRKANGNSRIPHTITHLQIVKPSDFDRFKKLNILASFQLQWAFGDMTTIDIVKPYIDPSLYKWQYSARSMLQAGTTICGASDWPVSTANPFEAIYNAETRKGPMGVLDSTQCMPRMEMFYAYTSEAAKALMMEKTIGTLQEGKSADMICIDRDVLTVSPEAMQNAQVLWTMFEGKIVYENTKDKKL